MVGSPIAEGAAHLVASWKEWLSTEAAEAAGRALIREYTLTRRWKDDVLRFKTKEGNCPEEVKEWLRQVESVHSYGESLELEREGDTLAFGDRFFLDESKTRIRVRPRYKFLEANAMGHDRDGGSMFGPSMVVLSSDRRFRGELFLVGVCVGF